MAPFSVWLCMFVSVVEPQNTHTHTHTRTRTHTPISTPKHTVLAITRRRTLAMLTPRLTFIWYVTLPLLHKSMRRQWHSGTKWGMRQGWGQPGEGRRGGGGGRKGRGWNMHGQIFTYSVKLASLASSSPSQCCMKGYCMCIFLDVSFVLPLVMNIFNPRYYVFF